MKPQFPHMKQAAMNMTNGSKEAVDRVNQWTDSHGGSVEHLSYEQVCTEVKEILRKD